jgi:surface polysaccharide O-acyltransferase-like enzyme
MTPGSERLFLFDVFRIIAILGVILLHQKTAGIEPHVAEAARLSFRWCVPFFFLLTGFFLPGAGGRPAIDIKRLSKVTVIIFAASIIYFPLSLSVNGFAALDLASILVGPWFHLWFLSSMLMGFLIIIGVSSLTSSGRLMAIALVVICFTLLADFMAMIDPASYTPVFAMLRHLSGFAFISVGFAVSQSRGAIGPLGGCLLVFFGLVLIYAETAFLGHFGYSQMGRQMPLGAVIMAFGVMWFCLGTRVEVPGASKLSRIGRDHTLAIYVLHPIFLKVADVAMGMVVPSLWTALAGIAFAFLASLVTSLGWRSLVAAKPRETTI